MIAALCSTCDQEKEEYENDEVKRIIVEVSVPTASVQLHISPFLLSTNPLTISLKDAYLELWL